MNEVLLPGRQCGSNSLAVLVQVKGWQRSFQPSMKVSMAVMRSRTLLKLPRRMAWCRDAARSVGGAKVLPVAIISAVGTALAGLAAVITALATLGVVPVWRVTGHPPTSPPSPAGAKLSRPEGWAMGRRTRA